MVLSSFNCPTQLINARFIEAPLSASVQIKLNYIPYLGQIVKTEIVLIKLEIFLGSRPTRWIFPLPDNTREEVEERDVILQQSLATIGSIVEDM